jgi:hypothetical protein
LETSTNLVTGVGGKNAGMVNNGIIKENINEAKR